METTELSKILVFGGTGYIGKFIVRASVMLGHPTYVYARPITPNTNPSKVQLHAEFQSMGVTIIQGELSEQEKLVSTIKQIDIVISVLATPYVIEQLKIIDAMQIAGNVKRFIPSEFGCEEDKIDALPPHQALLDKKNKIRRATEAAAIPFTYLSSVCMGEYFLNFFFHPLEQSEEVTIFGTGEAKAVFTWEKDVAIYTIKAANDERTCNRIVYFRPPSNVLSQLDLISLWEERTSKNYKKVIVPDEEIVKLAETSPHPHNARAAVLHSLFVKAGTTNFELEEDELEVSKLYPQFEYTPIDKLFDIFLASPPKFEYVEL